ncbi:MAG: hypothetical protein BECKG1743D_GA0114223_109691 [Candidatus Kentron sp. G]|nr:MAG: hypothetical protein BECKG1743E_GA0114224_109603 [Candidatus Kentron sp. G]VFN07047.1 MAG: hypothetical protein BECKG1743D_GA0114223_109691 [Candidatus Kentron sp. G]
MQYLPGGVADSLPTYWDRIWDRRLVVGIFFYPSAFFAEYNSAIVRPRGRFISGVKVPDRSMP